MITDINSWDTETAAVLPKNARLEKHMPLGFTTAASLLSGQEKPTVWYAGMMSPGLMGPVYAPKMTPDEVKIMLLDVADKYLQGYTPATWNGAGFEWRNSAHETGWWQECKVMSYLHLDMMFHLLALCGYFVSQDRAMRGMGLPGKAASPITGADAPELWPKDPETVIEYVQQDVIQPLQFFERTKEREWVAWAYKRTEGINASINRYAHGYGKASLPGGWLPVYKVLELPEPDVSGFSNPPPTRADVIEWMTDLPKLTEADRPKWNLPEVIFDIALAAGF
jgi:hypothetical protein